MSSAIALLPSSSPYTCRVRRSLSTTPFLKHGNDARSGYSNNRKKKEKLSLSWAALPFDLSPPPIDLDPLETMEVADLEVSEYGMTNTLDNDDEALDAVNNGVAVVDLSDYGRIRVSGQDRIQFLHNQTTANFECLSEGQGCDTVFVTSTARTIDISHAWIMKNAIILVVSPTTCGSITEMLNKYIFFADKVEIQDITNQTRLFALLGPKSIEIMKDFNVGNLVGQPYGSHKHYSLVGGMPLTIAKGSIISEEGFTLLMSPSAAGSVWKSLLDQGAVPMGSTAWETLRILQGHKFFESAFWIFIVSLLFLMGIWTFFSVFLQLVKIEQLYQEVAFFLICLWLLDFLKSAYHVILIYISVNSYSIFVYTYCLCIGAVTCLIFAGRPAPGKELTDEFNVLEAGLWRAVSLNKGCYKGQETISRLVTYDGIKQRLWGLRLSSTVEPGSIITVDGKKVGKLTSFTAGRKVSEPFGLGYIKRRTASEGDSVTVGESAVGTLVEVPFLREQLPLSKGVA